MPAGGPADDIRMANNEAVSQRQLRAVVADDDPLIVELIGRWLRDADFEVIEAVDGASAFECLRRQPA